MRERNLLASKQLLKNLWKPGAKAVCDRVETGTVKL